MHAGIDMGGKKKQTNKKCVWGGGGGGGGRRYGQGMKSWKGKEHLRGGGYVGVWGGDWEEG